MESNLALSQTPAPRLAGLLRPRVLLVVGVGVTILGVAGLVLRLLMLASSSRSDLGIRAAIHSETLSSMPFTMDADLAVWGVVAIAGVGLLVVGLVRRTVSQRVR